MLSTQILVYCLLIILCIPCASFLARGFARRPLIALRPKILMNYNNGGGGPDDSKAMEPRSSTPNRRDICRVYVSGVVGTEPREAYLTNGHYVVNFAIATVGHFTAQHEWEKYKPTETMWMNVEMWDTQAKQAMEGSIYKGAKIAGMGHLIFNKWTDKTTGEERKQYKVRILQLMSPEEIEEIEIASGVADGDYYNPPIGSGDSQHGHQQGGGGGATDSQFSNNSPHDEDQTPGSGVWGDRPRLSHGDGPSMHGDEDDEDNDGRDPRIPF